MTNITNNIPDIFNKYKQCINDLNESVWKGKSKDNFKTCTEAFINEYQNALTTQIDNLIEAKKNLENYNKFKEEYNNYKISYNNAIANNDKDNANSYLKSMSKAKENQDSLKEKIKNLLQQIIDAKIKANVTMTDATNGIGYKSCDFNEYKHHPNGHKGIDIAAPTGTPVTSLGNGKVIEAKFNKARGYYIVIDHGEGYKTLYQHFQYPTHLKIGDTVNTGDQIGLVGNTGKSTGPHLHLEVKVPNGQGTVYDWDGKKTLVNPEDFDYSLIQ